MNNYLDIVCTLINAFGSRPISDIDTGAEMASLMLEAFNEANAVQIRLWKIVTERSEWHPNDANIQSMSLITTQKSFSLFFDSALSYCTLE